MIERSVARIPLYEGLDTVRIDTDAKTAWEAAEEICRINAEVFKNNRMPALKKEASEKCIS